MDIDQLVAAALAEDVGSGDVTSAATVDPTLRGRARITQKAPGVVFGLDVAAAVFKAVDPETVLTKTGPEGVWREHGPVLEIVGSAVALLAAERTALNFMQQLSGVATLTARCVRAVEGTGPGSWTPARPLPACGCSRSRRWSPAAAPTIASGSTTGS